MAVTKKSKKDDIWEAYQDLLEQVDGEAEVEEALPPSPKALYYEQLGRLAESFLVQERDARLAKQADDARAIKREMLDLLER